MIGDSDDDYGGDEHFSSTIIECLARAYTGLLINDDDGDHGDGDDDGDDDSDDDDVSDW